MLDASCSYAARLYVLVVCAGVFGLVSPRAVSAQGEKPEKPTGTHVPTVQEILNWLPADTETLVMTRGPYQLEWTDEDSPKPRSLKKSLEGLSYLPLVNVRKGKYVKKLTEQEVALAVEGA